MFEPIGRSADIFSRSGPWPAPSGCQVGRKSYDRGSNHEGDYNQKGVRWTRPLFAIVAAAAIVLSLSPTGPETGAGIGAECVASINEIIDVDNRDEGGGEILMSSSPAERD